MVEGFLPLLLNFPPPFGFQLEEPFNFVESALRAEFHALEAPFVAVQFFGEIYLLFGPPLGRVLVQGHFEPGVFLQNLFELLFQDFNS